MYLGTQAINMSANTSKFTSQQFAQIYTENIWGSLEDQSCKHLLQGVTTVQTKLAIEECCMTFESQQAKNFISDYFF
jgi:hypothetical protein